MEKTAELLDRISKVGLWHQRIDLGGGVVTPGRQDSPALLAQIQLPEDLSGMRVLDLGARDGFFSFECERRGAKEVVALDYVDENITGFSLCKEVLNSNVRFINGNVYAINPSDLGYFDLVLFLGLIYHLRHPVLALDRIYDVMNPGGQIFVVSHTIDHGLVDPHGSWGDLAEQYKDLQIAQFYSNGRLGNDVTSPWAPNQKCLEMMVRDCGFNVDRSWTVAFRGGVSGRRIVLPDNHPRWIDTANSFDMRNIWKIVERGRL